MSGSFSFSGAFPATLDDKGRLALPARHREALAECPQISMAPDLFEPCLLLFPRSTWEDFKARVTANANLTKPLVRRVQRNLIGPSVDLDLDANGRLLIPAGMRDRAGLVKRLALVGVCDKIEIWNADNWREQETAWLADDRAELLASMEEFSALSL